VEGYPYTKYRGYGSGTVDLPKTTHRMNYEL